MSTIPLSSTDNRHNPDSDSSTTPYHGSVSEPVEDTTISEKSMDAHIEKALKTHAPNLYDEDGNEKTEAPAPRKSLDEHIAEGLDRHEQAQAERDSFAESKNTRAELHARYAHYDGATQERTIANFLAGIEAVRKNPAQGAIAIAESYARASAFDVKAAKAARVERPEVRVVDGKRYTSDVLSHCINQAMEVGEEKALYQNTADQRKALKELWPNLTYAQSIEKILDFDTRARIAPLDVAGEVYALAGGAWLPHQQASQQERDVAVAHVTEAAKVLPGMAHKEVREKMAHIVATDPRFANLNEVDALNHSYRMAMETVAQEQHQTRAGVSWAKDQHEGLMRTNPQFANAVIRTLESDKAFDAHIKNVRDPVEMYRLAYSWTAAKQQTGSVAKARRAAPIKSSTGANPGGGRSARGGIDGAIANAMANYKE